MTAVTICTDLVAHKSKICHCFHCFPIYLPWSDGTRCHDLSFWTLSFKPTFSLSSFTSIKGFFSSSSVSAIKVVSSAYLRLLIFLPVILIPVCASFDCVDHKKLWKILKKMGIADHLTCLQRNLYADQEATVRTGHETTDWFRIGKGVRQGCILSPCLFNLYAEYIMRNARLDETQTESRLPGEISITSHMQMTPPLWQEVKRS